MPNRLIRDGLLDSERYWSVTIEARQLFVHLMLLADDFGCVSLAPLFLRRRCFNDAPTNEKIARLITEITDADLIRCYEANGAQYAFIPRFDQRLQRETLKHPKPPESLLAGDDKAIAKFHKIKKDAPIPTVPKPLASVGQPPEVKGREEKQAPASPAQATIWNLGVSLLTEQGLSEPTARRFLGSLLGQWEESYVADAIQAAVGKGDAKSYMRGVLKDKPAKGVVPEKKVAL